MELVQTDDPLRTSLLSDDAEASKPAAKESGKDKNDDEVKALRARLAAQEELVNSLLSSQGGASGGGGDGGGEAALAPFDDQQSADAQFALSIQRAEYAARRPGSGSGAPPEPVNFLRGLLVFAQP